MKIKTTPLVKQLLYSKFQGNAATRKGHQQESATKVAYESGLNKGTAQCYTVKETLFMAYFL